MHILLKCPNLEGIQCRCFDVDICLRNLFESVNSQNIIDFIEEAHFLHASAMLKHVIAIGLTSVRPSVRLSVCLSVRHTLAPYQNG